MKYKVSLIVPTLGERSEYLLRLFKSLNNQTFKDFEVLVISQSNHEFVEELLNQVAFNYKHIKILMKGLSIARNEGLKHVNGEIVAFSDDDCWYPQNALEFIVNKFDEENSQIACFQHIDPVKNKYPKKYPSTKEYDLNKRRILQQSSIDIFVNTKYVKDYKNKFDETFGVGAKYISGEEIIYLMDLKNKGYKIDYFPKIISFHPFKYEGNKKMLDERNILSKGPLFKRLFGNTKGTVMFLMFILKKIGQIENKPRSIILGLKECLRYRKHKT